MKLIDILKTYNFRLVDSIDGRSIENTQTIRIYPDTYDQMSYWFEFGLEDFHSYKEEGLLRFKEILNKELLNRKVQSISQNNDLNICEIYLVKCGTND